MNKLSQNIITNIDKVMEVNFGSDLKSGNLRQIYEAIMTATNMALKVLI